MTYTAMLYGGPGDGAAIPVYSDDIKPIIGWFPPGYHNRKPIDLLLNPPGIHYHPYEVFDNQMIGVVVRYLLCPSTR